MKTARGVLLACLLLAVVSSTGPGLHAEVSAETQASINLIILGVIEGPDPISQAMWWEPVRDVDPVLFLNQSGADRGDGRPSVGFHPHTGWAHITWAYDAGNFQVAYSCWTGTGWTPTELLTSGVEDSLDPRTHVGPDGTVYVAWWDTPVERVWLSNKPAQSTSWESSEQVTSLVEAGRRPSVAEWEGRAVVGYERSSVAGGQEIVVAMRMSPGAYSTEVVATTTSKEPLDILVHVEEGKLWLDWRHAADTYAWLSWDVDGWGAVHVVPWTDDSWTGEEEARRFIEDQALAR